MPPQEINERFNHLLELQRSRLLTQYQDSHEVTSKQIDLVISHSYFLLHEVTKVHIESLNKVKHRQKQVFAMAKWVSGLFVSILMALIITIITKYVLE